VRLGGKKKTFKELEDELKNNKLPFWGNEAVWRTGHKTGVSEGVSALLKNLMELKLIDYEVGYDIWGKLEKVISESALEDVGFPYQLIKDNMPLKSWANK